MANWLDAALRYHEMGFNCIPINDHKQPQGQWARWRETRQMPADLEQIFAGDYHGIALITGFNNLEAIDVDVKNDPDGRVWDDLSAELNAPPYDAITAYATQRTPSGGAHLLYRCMTKPPGNNSRLARKNGRAIIETRGSGGIVAVWPTPGYTISDKQNLVSALFDEERTALMELCATYNEDMPEKRAEPRSVPQSQTDQEKPWITFNREHGREYVLGVLENHGWEVIREKGARTFLRRPGKDVGISADYHSEHNLFKVFTTSTEFSPDTAYSPFAVTVMLEYGGDYGAALRGLGLNQEPQIFNRVVFDKAAGGIAPPAEQRVMPANDAEFRAKWPDVFFYDPDVAEEEERWTITYRTKNATYGVGGPGLVISLAGHEKSRKSTLLYTLIMGGIIKQPLLGFQWEQPLRRALVFDTEQANKWIIRAGARLKKVSPTSNWRDHVEFFGLRKISDTQRLDFIKEKIYLCGDDLDLIVIDGIADLCNDFNDLGASKKVIHELMNLHPTAMVAGVIHLNKGNGEERGHLGAVFKQKSDVILRVTYDEETKVSTVRCHRSKDIPFPDVEFTQDESGMVIPASSLVNDKYIDI